MPYKFNIFTGTFDIVSVTGATIDGVYLLENDDYFITESGDYLATE